MIKLQKFIKNIAQKRYSTTRDRSVKDIEVGSASPAPPTLYIAVVLLHIASDG